MRLAFVVNVVLCGLLSGCTALPQVSRQPQFFNPFPQVSRVAVLPFFNQSNEPTLNGFDAAVTYRNELQKIPGFEVMPVGVVEQQLLAHRVAMNEITDFQQLARLLRVDAVIVGSVTDFTPYYPPRLGLAVNWYAANPCFHPIPPGYGLPWGTSEEEFIPDSLAWEAEFALARGQLKAQTPQLPPSVAESDRQFIERTLARIRAETQARSGSRSAVAPGDSELADEEIPRPLSDETNEPQNAQGFAHPQGLAPSADEAATPGCDPHRGPIIELVRQYDASDADLTERLSNYFFTRDDLRFGGWQSYLQRKDDFMRFCCHLHIADTLAARGGAGKSRLVWRWPFDRYQP